MRSPHFLWSIPMTTSSLREARYKTGFGALQRRMTAFLLRVLNAARNARVRVFYAMHRRYRPGDYETWKYIAPIQRAAWTRKTFEYGTGAARSVPSSSLSQARWSPRSTTGAPEVTVYRTGKSKEGPGLCPKCRNTIPAPLFHSKIRLLSCSPRTERDPLRAGREPREQLPASV